MLPYAIKINLYQWFQQVILSQSLQQNFSSNQELISTNSEMSKQQKTRESAVGATKPNFVQISRKEQKFSLKRKKNFVE